MRNSNGDTSRSPRASASLGWIAVALSVGLSLFCALWGGIDYRKPRPAPELIWNLCWIWAPVLGGLLALYNRVIGAVFHVIMSVSLIVALGLQPAILACMVMLVLFIGALYSVGRPKPAKWAVWGLLVLPFCALIFSATYASSRMSGLKIERDGNASYSIVTFQSKGHAQEIEERRKEEHSTDASQLDVVLNEPAAVGVPHKPKNDLPLAGGDAYWTELRGPCRQGVYAETDISTEWAAGELPLQWKRLVGGGYASMVIADGTVFTIEQRRTKEVVAAYDLNTGREKWIHGWDAEFRESLGGDGPRSTPTWHEGRIYALGATGEFRCLDARSGRRIWSKNILLENQTENLQWGMAASPLIVDDKVIVMPGGKEGKSIVAYNRLTGETIWKVLDDPQEYTSPELVTLAGRTQILAVSAKRAMGLNPIDGSLLWEYPWDTKGGVNTAQPIVISDNRFFISSGYGHGAALVEVTERDEKWEAHTIWENMRMKNKFASSVFHNGFIYGFDEAFLGCMDADTGEVKWKHRGYGYGQVLLASGHLIISSETGEIALVIAQPDVYWEVARFQAIKGKTWNIPAVAEGKLVVRNATEMACFKIAK